MLLSASLIAASLTPCQGARDTGQSSEQFSERPGFLIVLMDDVGRDKIGLYGVGTDPPPTPHLDGLAARGTLFANAWAAQACSPTRAALLTGRYSDRTRIGGVIKPDDGRDTPLALSEYLLPEALPGYATAHVGKWHLGDVSAPLDHPVLSGFETSIGWDGPNDYFRWSECINGELEAKTGYFPASMAGHVSRIIRECNSPYFVYYATKLGHTPFHDPPEHYHSLGEPPGYPLRQHKAMVETIDTLLGRVLEHVDLSANFVFVLGDNGSPGHTVAPPFLRAQSKGSLYEGGLNVPLIVAGPGVARGATCIELVHVTDLFATVRELAGLGEPDRGAEDSISFVGLLRDPKSGGQRDHLYVHRFPHEGAKGPDRRALRTKRWKLIEDLRAKTFQLYDLESDPFERNDLAAAAELSEAAPGTSETATVNRPAEALRRLRALFPTF